MPGEIEHGLCQARIGCFQGQSDMKLALDQPLCDNFRHQLTQHVSFVALESHTLSDLVAILRWHLPPKSTIQHETSGALVGPSPLRCFPISQTAIAASGSRKPGLDAAITVSASLATITHRNKCVPTQFWQLAGRYGYIDDTETPDPYVGVFGPLAVAQVQVTVPSAWPVPNMPRYALSI